ncbi:50S ribosomal protein L17 [Chryseobacterium sp.]|uniref:50S ribosomal protein L17 n=1 Tax=Chryseobacterium sp. TaxID=1871047 RepID=UPI0025C25EE2|nr:50S ribosomal protein L17 [Chryseobacterium sp.]
MRHGKKFNHLGRTASHRSALLSNMACSLIEHKRINTTVAKAKALRVYVEPLLTKAKEDTTHNRRVVFSYLQNKEAVSELFRTVAPKIAERNGGYTRIIKTGFRPGDAADTALIELVDFNELYNPNAEEKKATRRSRRSTTAKKAEAVVAEAPKAEEKVEEPKVEATDSTEEKTEE